MSKDITPILEGWDYKPNEISVRKIKGLDGKEKIQLRLDLGLIQIELDGRPDGKRPYGKESMLEHYLALIAEHRAKYGTDQSFQLDSDDCLKLQQEAIQYYHRYLSLFHLGDYVRMARDTERNLQVFDLAKTYAIDDRDKWAFEQYRPYVIMMNARAKGSICLEKKDYPQALREIDEGVASIKRFYREYGQTDLLENSVEINFLKNWAKELRENRPLTLKEKLKNQLEEAVRNEEYERAAQLRDQIRTLPNTED